MTDIILESNTTPTILVEAQARLVVRGWEKNEVQANSKSEAGITVSQEEDTFTVTCTSPSSLYVPEQAAVTFTHANGDLAVKGVSGAIKVIESTSRAAFKNVGPITVDSADGSLTLKHIQGDVHIRYCSGMVTASGISGDFLAELVDSHLILKDIHGSVRGETSGNASLNLAPPAGTEVKVNARGVLSCKVPESLDANVSIQAQGPILVNVGEVVERSIGGGSLSLTFGEGAAAMNLSAGGPASLLSSAKSAHLEYDVNMDFEDVTSEFGSIASDIASQVNQQLESHLHILDAQLENFADLAGSWPGISTEKAEEIAKRAQEKAERAREKVLRATERAQARMAKKIAAAQRREARKARHSGRSRSVNMSFGRRQPAADPVSDDERMLILNMLAEKKITAEEAEKLLAALEGKE